MTLYHNGFSILFTCSPHPSHNAIMCPGVDGKNNKKESMINEEKSSRYETLSDPDKVPNKEVLRDGDVVHRQTGPWTSSVHSLLRHLQAVGFAGAPRIVGTGFDDRGLETVTFIEGDFMHPGPWTLGGVAALGHMLRSLHDATATYVAPADAVWRQWFGRDLGRNTRIIGHCDAGPWNIVARDGLPVALIDWDFAGPVDPTVDLAQSCWLNAKLHSDDVAEREGLPPLNERATQLKGHCGRLRPDCPTKRWVCPADHRIRCPLSGGRGR